MRKVYCINYRHLLNGQWGRAFALSKDKLEELRAMLAGSSASGVVSIHPGYTEVTLDKLTFEEIEIGLELVGMEVQSWERIHETFGPDDLARDAVKEIKNLQEFGRELFDLHDEKMRKERLCQADGTGNGAPGNGAGAKDSAGGG